MVIIEIFWGIPIKQIFLVEGIRIIFLLSKNSFKNLTSGNNLDFVLTDDGQLAGARNVLSHIVELLIGYNVFWQIRGSVLSKR